MRHIKRIKRITWILCAVWVVFVIGYNGFANFRASGSATYTVDSDSISFLGDTFVSDNSSGFGTIYKMTSDGVVDKVFVNHRRNYIAGWDILKLCTDNTDGQVGGSFYALMSGGETSEGYVPYRLVSFTTDVIIEAISPKFYLHTGLTPTGLTYEDGILYITGISSTRQDVYIYRYEEYDMIRIEGMKSEERQKLTEVATELNESSTERNPSGLLYADAEYSGGNLYARVDDQAADEYFAEDTEVKARFDNRTEPLFLRLKARGVSFVDIIAYCLVGCAIIIVISLLLDHRKKLTYMLVITESFIVVASVCVLALSTVENHGTAVREFVRNEIYTLSLLGDNAPADIGSDSFYTSTAFTTFYGNMNAIVDRSDDMAEIKEIAVVDPASGSIIMSTRGHGGGTVSYVFGETARSLMTSGDTSGAAECMMGGAKHHLIAVTMNGAPQYKLLCVAQLLTPAAYIRTFEPTLLVVIFLLFVLASAGAIAIILVESNALSRIGNALERLGAGDENIEIPEVVMGYDIRRMWSGINEIQKNLKRASREKFMTYEAYFRFAPKKIEKILGRDIITEVSVGDTKKIQGTVAIVKADTSRHALLDESNLNGRNGLFSLAEKYGNSTGGIFISAEQNLSIMRVLFLEGNKDSIRFGTDFSREAAADPKIPEPTIILHYDSYIYGVAGTVAQSFTFLSSEDITTLELYAGWLGSLGVSMVVTEPVRNRESGAWDFRYIGFIIPNQNDRSRRINFYEVLDASDGVVRRGKKKTMADFKKALELFYEKDFYFARNAFTDIIREVPSDQISKWYLFECERLLNEQASPDFVGELHFD